MLRSEEKVVGRVRHEGLLAYVAGDETSGSWGGSPVGVETLDEGSFRQELTASGSLHRPDDLQQEASNRACVRATLIGTGSDRM